MSTRYGSPKQVDDGVITLLQGENDARFIHPELRRFKLEKTAK